MGVRNTSRIKILRHEVDKPTAVLSSNSFVALENYAEFIAAELKSMGRDEFFKPVKLQKNNTYYNDYLDNVLVISQTKLKRIMENLTKTNGAEGKLGNSPELYYRIEYDSGKLINNGTRVSFYRYHENGFDKRALQHLGNIWVRPKEMKTDTNYIKCLNSEWLEIMQEFWDRLLAEKGKLILK